MVDGYNQNTLYKSIKFPNNNFVLNIIIKYQEKRKCEASLDCKNKALNQKRQRQTDRQR